MRATARVAAAQRAHSIVLCTPTASYARLRSLHVAAASPRAMPSKGDSLARGQRAASRCGAGFYSPVDLLAEEQPGGQVCLQVEGMDEPLVVNKALLSLMSPVLWEEIARGKSSWLEVTGDPEAWQFIMDYPLMDTKTRNIKLEPNKDSTALLLAKVLEVAVRYEMQVLLDEFEAFRTSWTRYTNNSFQNDKPTPETPAWWIDLATKHPFDSYKLAGPAICALLRKSTYRAYGDDVELHGCWHNARSAHLQYGEKQEGELWGLVCQLLEGCNE